MHAQACSCLEVTSLVNRGYLQTGMSSTLQFFVVSSLHYLSWLGFSWWMIIQTIWNAVYLCSYTCIIRDFVFSLVDLIVALNECYFWDKKRVAHMYLESELMEAQRVLDILSGQEGSQHRNLMNQVKPLMDFTQRRTAANMDRRRRDLNANQRITGSNSNRRRTDSNSIKKETDSRSSEEKTADIESIKKKTKPKKKKIDLSAALNDWQQQWKENKCSLAVVSDMEKGRKAQGLPPLKVNHFCCEFYYNMSIVFSHGGRLGMEDNMDWFLSVNQKPVY